VLRTGATIRRVSGLGPAIIWVGAEKWLGQTWKLAKMKGFWASVFEADHRHENIYQH